MYVNPSTSLSIHRFTSDSDLLEILHAACTRALSPACASNEREHEPPALPRPQHAAADPADPAAFAAENKKIHASNMISSSNQSPTANCARHTLETGRGSGSSSSRVCAGSSRTAVASGCQVRIEIFYVYK